MNKYRFMKSNFNLFIPFPNNDNIGGPQTFMKNLKVWLDDRDYEYRHEIKRGCTIFFPISYNIKELKKIKKHGGRVIQRLDGIHYKTKHDDYLEQNSVIKDIYTNFSDHIIFQSEYSRKQCFAMLGEKCPTQYSIIYNGVNTDVFFPYKEKKRSDILKFITTGNFRNLDMLEPIILALDSLVGDFNFTLRIIGPVINESLKELLKRDYVIYDGDRNLKDVAEELRAADIFLYSHLNPPCPNSVLEAVATGLPVVGYDSGSMSELCVFSTELLAYVSKDIFQQYEDFNYNRLKEKIILCVENFDNYKEKALLHCKDYSFKICGQKYWNVFNNVVNVKQANNNAWKKRDVTKLLNHVLRIPGKIIGNSTILTLINISQAGKEEKFINALISKACLKMTPNESLNFLFELEKNIYKKVGVESKRYGSGEHSKHRHLNYHEWFISNIDAGAKIIDIGCGTGDLANDIALNIKNVEIFAIDIVENNINIAKEQNYNKAINYVHGDAMTDIKKDKFDIIIMSNVLEHIEKRIDFLKNLKLKLKPQKYLFRVPSYERDWRVPLMKEIGFDYRLDRTHFIEYTFEKFSDELEKADLEIIKKELKWGEIWAVAKPK